MENPTELSELNGKKIDGIEITSRLMNMILEMKPEEQMDLLKLLDEKGYGGSRRYVRHHLAKPWAVFFELGKDQTVHADFIQDISRCGMFIESSRSFNVGDKITVRFEVPTSRKIYKILGEIVRLQEKGMGVKFIQQMVLD